MELILASSSESRKKLLEQINIIPDREIIPDINEIPKKKELPAEFALRMALEKNQAAIVKNNQLQNVVDSTNIKDNFIMISADTVTACGRLILPKSITNQDVEYSLNKLSGRRHKVISAICISNKIGSNIVTRTRIVKSTLKFKKLPKEEIKQYANSGQGIGKSGGYDLSGFAASFVSFISGSYSNILGLPLYEISNMLKSFGVKSKVNL